MNKNLVLSVDDKKAELQFYKSNGTDYLNLDIQNLRDTEIVSLFDEHCSKYSEFIKIGELINTEKDKYTNFIKDPLNNNQNRNIYLTDTPDGFVEVISFVTKSEREIFDVTTVSGKKVACSQDHLLQTNYGTDLVDNHINYTLTKNLKINDDVFIKNKLGGYIKEKIKSINKRNEKEIVYDWTINHENSRYYAGEDGFISHNSGKTFLTLNAVKNAQKLGYTPIYFDTEGAIDAFACKNFGIDLNNFRWEPVSEIEKLKSMFAVLIKSLTELKIKGKEIPKFLLILDSIGMVASNKEIEDARTGNSAADMTRAKQIRSFFRIITSDLNSLGIPMIFTNHVGVNIGGYGDPVVQGGGSGVVYSPSITLFLSKSKETEGTDANKQQVGILVTAKTGKNRFAKPKIVKFPIFFDRPFNRYMGIQDYISWETVGIAKGNLLTQKEFDKLKDSEKDKVHKFKPDNSDEQMYFLPKETARNYVVKHLGESIDKRQLFTPRVMEPLIDVFDELVKKDFQFSSQDLDTEIDELLYDSDSDEIEI